MAGDARLLLDHLHFDAQPGQSATSTRVTARLRVIDPAREPPVLEIQLAFNVRKLPADLRVSAYPRWVAEELHARLGRWLAEGGSDGP